MKIAHIALWVNDLVKMKIFYSRFFSGVAGDNYANPEKNFESCFIHFQSGISIELMRKTDQLLTSLSEGINIGFNHIAFSVENREEVDKLTSILAADGYKIISNPRITGDGYYESIISDPEGNIIEIVI